MAQQFITAFIHSLIHPPFADSCLIAMTCFCACSFSSFSTTTSYWCPFGAAVIQFQPARPRPAPSGTNRIALLFTFVHICSQPPSIIHHHRVSYKLVSIKLHSLIVPSTCPLWTLCVAAAVPCYAIGTTWTTTTLTMPFVFVRPIDPSFTWLFYRIRISIEEIEPVSIFFLASAFY